MPSLFHKRTMGCLLVLLFVAVPALMSAENPQVKSQLATFGMGCFWHSQEIFDLVPGVLQTQVGFSGGKVEHPTYQQVCTDETGHAEVVQVTYDPAQISYEELLRVFWKSHDPTQINRQGPDVGKQYRSIIFYHTPEQKNILEQSLERFREEGVLPEKIATEFRPAEPFYPAEGYHQHYYSKKDKKNKRSFF